MMLRAAIRSVRFDDRVLLRPPFDVEPFDDLPVDLARHECVLQSRMLAARRKIEEFAEFVQPRVRNAAVKNPRLAHRVRVDHTKRRKSRKFDLRVARGLVGKLSIERGVRSGPARPFDDRKEKPQSVIDRDRVLPFFRRVSVDSCCFGGHGFGRSRFDRDLFFDFERRAIAQDGADFDDFMLPRFETGSLEIDEADVGSFRFLICAHTMRRMRRYSACDMYRRSFSMPCISC